MVIERLWVRLPVLPRAVVVGLAVGLAGTLPWAKLIGANTRHPSSVPGAVPLRGAFLYLYWLYVVGGRGGPRATADARRASARAHCLSGDMWGQALVTGVLGLIGVLLLQGILSRLVTLPRQQDLDVSNYPLVTVILWVVMSAVVSGVVEETAFRGYMQGPIERRHGLLVAILVTGSLFGFSHFAHPEVGLGAVPRFTVAIEA